MSGDNASVSERFLQGRSTSQFALEEIVRPVAIATMMACIAASIGNFIITITPGWPVRFFVITTFLVSLESIHAQRLLTKRDIIQRDQVRFRFVEWVVILLVIRFGVYFSYGVEQLLRDMSSWSTDPASFFSAGFLMTALVMLVFWAVSLFMARAVQSLESTPFEKPPVVTDPDFYLRITIPQHGQVNRRAYIQNIVTVFFIGGVIMIALAGLAQMDVRTLSVVTRPQLSVIINVMLYFLVGLLLISQMQLTTLKATWEVQGIQVANSIGRRWLLYLLVFLVVIGVISALLPVDYSVGLVAALGAVVRWIAYAFLQAVYFIIAGVTFLFMYIGSLFGGKPAEPIVAPTPLPTPEPPPTTVGVASEATWFQVARSLLFWGVLAAVSVYAVLRFLNDRWDLFRRLKGIRLFGWLFALFGGLQRGADQLWGSLKRQVQRQAAALRGGLQPRRSRGRSWRDMNTRERVRFLYLALIDNAAQQGLARAPSETPIEYEADLVALLPESDKPAHELTDSFIQARYSEHPIGDELVALAQQDWREVKRALNEHKRRQAQAGRPMARE